MTETSECLHHKRDCLFTCSFAISLPIAYCKVLSLRLTVF